MEALQKTSEAFFTDMGLAPCSGTEDENTPRMGVIISFKTPRFQVKATSLSKKMEGLLRIDQPFPITYIKGKGFIETELEEDLKTFREILWEALFSRLFSKKTIHAHIDDFGKTATSIAENEFEISHTQEQLDLYNGTDTFQCDAFIKGKVAGHELKMEFDLQAGWNLTNRVQLTGAVTAIRA